METGLQVLRAKIRGFQVAGVSIHRKIVKSSGLRRMGLWHKKRALGDHCRIHLIAYGLLRGVSYDEIEKCAKENKPYAESVFNVMLTHASWQVKNELTLEKVKLLLDQEANLYFMKPEAKIVDKKGFMASLRALLGHTEKQAAK